MLVVLPSLLPSSRSPESGRRRTLEGEFGASSPDLPPPFRFDTRMAFPGKFAGGGGGKKGPRAHLGSFKNKQVKLRPAPEKRATDATAANEQAYPGEDERQDEEEEMVEGEDEYGYRENLRREAKPCEGMVISVTGCKTTKDQLLEIAVEMGGVGKGALEADTTHLIADGPGGAKYEVRLVLCCSGGWDLGADP